MHTSFSHRLVQTPPSSWPASDSTWPHVFSFGRASLCCCCCCCAAHLVNGRRYDRDSCATAGVPKVCATEMGCEFTFLMLHFAFVIVAVFGFFFRDSSRLFWSFSSGSSDPNRHNMHTYTPIARRKSWNLMCIHRERMMRVCVCVCLATRLHYVDCCCVCIEQRGCCNPRRTIYLSGCFEWCVLNRVQNEMKNK